MGTCVPSQCCPRSESLLRHEKCPWLPQTGLWIRAGRRHGQGGGGRRRVARGRGHVSVVANQHGQLASNRYPMPQQRNKSHCAHRRNWPDAQYFAKVRRCAAINRRLAHPERSTLGASLGASYEGLTRRKPVRADSAVEPPRRRKLGHDCQSGEG